MSRWNSQGALSFLCGLLFALGLGWSRMTDPSKVMGFLNLFSSSPWDPSLIFVMIGAIGTHALLYHTLIQRRQRQLKTPLWAKEWFLPTVRNLPPQTILGAILFGVGWGLGGFCPGPGLVSLAHGEARPVMFTIGMILGMSVAHFLLKIIVPLLKLPLKHLSK